jgi:hypothetical protein
VRRWLPSSGRTSSAPSDACAIFLAPLESAPSRVGERLVSSLAEDLHIATTTRTTAAGKSSIDDTL